AWLATGVDLPAAAAAVAAGERPDLTPTRRCTAAVRFLYPDADCVFEEVRVDPERLPDGGWEVRPVARAGQSPRRPRASVVGGRYAAVVAVGTGPGDCQRALDTVGPAVRLVSRADAGRADAGRAADLVRR